MPDLDTANRSDLRAGVHRIGTILEMADELHSSPMTCDIYIPTYSISGVISKSNRVVKAFRDTPYLVKDTQGNMRKAAMLHLRQRPSLHEGCAANE